MIFRKQKNHRLSFDQAPNHFTVLTAAQKAQIKAGSSSYKPFLEDSGLTSPRGSQVNKIYMNLVR